MKPPRKSISAGKLTPGYSGTPLAKKLGIGDGTHVLARHAPTEYSKWHDLLPLGFVDIKVCAVSDVWSGLKLVVRKELR